LAKVKSVSSSNQDKVSRTRIILADDHPLMRHALRDVIEKQPDFKVIAEAIDGEEAVKLATELIPDVVIMDISMPNLNGLEATKQIKAKCPTVAVLVLTIHTDNEHILKILQAGANGYLTKDVRGNEVVHAIRALVAGEMVLSASVSGGIIKYASKYSVEPVSLESGEKITARELEILRLLAKGASNKEIAARLNLSLRTVKSYLVNLFLKLNVTSRMEAVAASMKKNILDIQDLK
jgi:NarL family two-component system response regulator LiaR